MTFPVYGERHHIRCNGETDMYKKIKAFIDENPYIQDAYVSVEYNPGLKRIDRQMKFFPISKPYNYLSFLKEATDLINSEPNFLHFWYDYVTIAYSRIRNKTENNVKSCKPDKQILSWKAELAQPTNPFLRDGYDHYPSKIFDEGHPFIVSKRKSGNVKKKSHPDATILSAIASTYINLSTE